MTANLGAAELEEGGGGGVTLFGVTLSTKILGIALAAIGVAGAAYITATITLPEFEKIDTTKSEIAKKEGNVKSMEQQIASKGDLTPKIEAAKQRNRDVLALLPEPQSIDVLLRDINAQLPSTVIISGYGITVPVEGSLESFQPGALTEGGGQYRTQTFALQFSSKYDDAINIMRNIERLRPQLVIRNLQMKQNDQIKPTETGNLSAEQLKVILDNLPPLLTVNLDLVAYIPLSEAELKAGEAAAAAAEAAKAPKK